MKVDITGASNFVNRMFEACGSFQWVREFLKNSIEAGATRVEFGLEWEAVRQDGVYRRCISDDGVGMTGEELLKFFRTLGAGGKKIGGVHDNFGVGAKIASLPWNPEGVVVVSYRGGVGSMIWIQLDEEGQEYELVEFEVAGRIQCVTAPAELDGIAWDAVAPEWARDHGTTIVLLGSDDAPHTMLGNPHAGETDIKGVSRYLNTRFWDLDGVHVTVAELRGNAESAWPSDPSDRADARRLNPRGIHGARHYVETLTSPKGKLGASGSVALCAGRVRADWYLWDGERPHIHNYAQRQGYVAVRYNGELFHRTYHKAHFRWFGVVESAVQQNLTVVLEPVGYERGGARWGVHPDQSRNHLIFSGDGEKGVELPLADWGLEFAENMPAEVREAIRAARGDLEGSIDDEEYRKRLQNRFGDRWRIAAPVAEPGEQRVGAMSDDEAELGGDSDEDIDGERRTRTRRKKRRQRRKSVRKVASSGDINEGAERDRLLDIPRYQLSPADNFERPWHLALWAPNDPAGPTVHINRDSPILQEIVEHHQERYPAVLADEVGRTIRAVFGEVAVAKIAHSQKLAKLISAEQLDQEYRSESALTTALMGLIAEESLIGRRLAQVGRAKRSLEPRPPSARA